MKNKIVDLKDLLEFKQLKQKNIEMQKQIENFNKGFALMEHLVETIKSTNIILSNDDSCDSDCDCECHQA